MPSINANRPDSSHTGTAEIAHQIVGSADEEYMQASIMDPAAHIVRGYPNQMAATYSDQLTGDQINDIIEYVKSLE